MRALLELGQSIRECEEFCLDTLTFTSFFGARHHNTRIRVGFCVIWQEVLEFAGHGSAIARELGAQCAAKHGSGADPEKVELGNGPT